MKNKQQGGFIQLIIVLIIALIVLGYFGFNVQQIIQSPSVSGNLGYAWGLAMNLWSNYLVVPVTFVWNKIIVGMFWNNFLILIERAQSAPPPGGAELPVMN
ncbi:MAG: hypothetical protein UX89_C0008G0014 [Parcubacteria group bacterium GW2011_GWA2_47_16]|nr:MAG: hypothetical protein UX89_C0008G0014 [Parcubacteria group bacterium GW2011_GWA2_47_16]